MKRASSISPPPLYSKEQLARYCSPFPKKAKHEIKQLKIMSWNCDGLDQYLSPSTASLDLFFKAKKTTKKSFLKQFLTRHDPHVLCIQEIHIKPDEKSDLTARLRVDAEAYNHHVCLPYSSTGRRRAGVLTLFKSSIQATTSTVPWDHEGRISMLHLPALTIINVYALNSTDYPYTDPKTHKKHGTRADRKREFDTLLAAEIKNLAKTQEVVAIGDFNVSRYPIDALHGHLRAHSPHAENRRHFNETYSFLRDIIREKYPQTEKYSWHSRAQGGRDSVDKARVDIIFATDGVKVIDADILEEVDRGFSDHCPMRMTLLNAGQ